MSGSEVSLSDQLHCTTAVQHEGVISALLKLTLEPHSLDELLEKSFDLLLSIPWLNVQSTGSILLVDENNPRMLIPKVQRGFSKAQLKTCTHIPIGQCLCGQVAATCEPLQTQHLDHRHTTLFQGIEPHGHVILPIKKHDGLLGILNLYLDEGLVIGDDEFNFLNNIANTLANIVERKHAEEALQRSEERFRKLVEGAPDGIVIVDAQGCIKLANEKIVQLSGYDRDELCGQPIEILVPESFRHNHKALRSSYISSPSTRNLSATQGLMARRKNGTMFPVEISLSPYLDHNEQSIIAIIHDISQRQRVQQELLRLASFAEHSPNPVIEINQDCQISYMNPTASGLFPELEEQGILHPIIADLKAVLKLMKKEKKTTTLRDVEFEDKIYEQKIINMPELGVTRLYIWDTTDMHKLTHELRYQASHDTLTNLANRSTFEHRLEQVISNARQNGNQHALLYIDLDQFKIVNDTCGHIAGDELLRQISAILKQTIRDRDTLARIGGDEFGLLLENCPLSKAQKIAETIRANVKAYRLVWQRKTFEIGTSIGLVAIHGNCGELKDVLSAADSACYVAKDLGRNRVHTYKEKDAEMTRHQGQMLWIPRIQQALNEDRFRFYYQEIAPLSVKAGDKKGIELLLRLLDEEGNEVLPNKFMPAAERYNLMPDIDRWVISRAFKIISSQAELDYDFVSINISGQSLGDRNFLSFLINHFSDYDVIPEQICFEITENSAIANYFNAIRLISTLKGLGCRFALDDFGSGLSSFAYLKSLPVDFLKIDGTFIIDIVENELDSAMVESIIRIGSIMGIYTIAEFAESKSIIDKVRDLGIDYVQGNAIADLKLFC